MTDFSMYFKTFGIELLAEPLVYLKCVFVCLFFFFVLKCPWMIEKKWFIVWSPLHWVQLKQAEHLGKVSVGVQRAGPGEGYKGEAPPYLRKFCIWWAIYTLLEGCKGVLLPCLFFFLIVFGELKKKKEKKSFKIHK